MKLYMLRTIPLSNFRSFSLYTQQWYISYRFADSLWAGANVTRFQATGRHCNGCIMPQAVTHSLVLLKMGVIIARNMLSWLELLINRYCCI